MCVIIKYYLSLQKLTFGPREVLVCLFSLLTVQFSHHLLVTMLLYLTLSILLYPLKQRSEVFTDHLD